MRLSIKGGLVIACIEKVSPLNVHITGTNDMSQVLYKQVKYEGLGSLKPLNL